MAGPVGTRARARPLRLVLVDNDPEVLELLTIDLSLEGHDIVGTAGDGEEALKVCAALRPDVVIVDYRMPPGLDGLQTIQRIRAARTAGVCVLYSNYRSPQISTEARRLGAVYVPKGPLRALHLVLQRVQDDLAAGHSELAT